VRSWEEEEEEGEEEEEAGEGDQILSISRIKGIIKNG
jgi:hypothetical protein